MSNKLNTNTIRNEQLSIEREIKINERSLAFLNALKVMHTNALSLVKFKESHQAQIILRMYETKFDKQKTKNDIVVIDSIINSIRKRQILLVEVLSEIKLMKKKKHYETFVLSDEEKTSIDAEISKLPGVEPEELPADATPEQIRQSVESESA